MNSFNARITQHMKIFQMVVLLCLGLNTVPAQTSDNKTEASATVWTEYTTLDNDLRISFPGNPTYTNSTINHNGVGYTIEQYTLHANGVYILTRSSYLPSLDNKQPENDLTQIVASTLRAINAKQLSLERFETNEYPGCLVTAELPKGERFYLKVVLLKSRYHLLGFLVAKTDDETQSPARRQFFESYKLLVPNPTGNIAVSANGSPLPILGIFSAADGEVDRYLQADENSRKHDPSATHSDIVSGGILNGKAIKLPLQKYPKGAKVSGMVQVRVVVDENGLVVAAQAVTGYPELQESAVQAARQARFDKSMLNGKPIRVVGRLIYQFVH